MSAFKDQVAKDIQGVFINPLEFAEQHQIGVVGLFDPIPVDAVVDQDVIEERKGRTSTEYAEGVYSSQIMVFVKAADLPNQPVRGQLFRLDGERYLVDNVASNMGVLEITIEANDQ